MGFAVVAEALDDHHPFFELHLAEEASSSSYVRFIRVACDDVADVLEKPGAADWSRVGDGQLEGEGRPRRWVEFSYPHHTERWHQRRYFLRVNDELGLVALAQARDTRSGDLFAGADAIARSFAPVIPPNAAQ